MSTPTPASPAPRPPSAAAGYLLVFAIGVLVGIVLIAVSLRAPRSQELSEPLPGRGHAAISGAGRNCRTRWTRIAATPVTRWRGCMPCERSRTIWNRRLRTWANAESSWRPPRRCGTHGTQHLSRRLRAASACDSQSTNWKSAAAPLIRTCATDRRAMRATEPVLHVSEVKTFPTWKLLCHSRAHA